MRSFLLDYWAAERNEYFQIPELGDCNSTLTEQDLLARYRKNGRGVESDDEYLAKVRYCLAQPKVRWPGLLSGDGRYLDDYMSFDFKHKYFGRGKLEYVDYLGLRADEPTRVTRVCESYNGEVEKEAQAGAWIECPLYEAGITKADVDEFWDPLHFKPPNRMISNCVYCFLKGTENLYNVMDYMNKDWFTDEYKNTPMDIQWWIDMEQKYGHKISRLKQNKNNELFPIEDHRIGFFGVKSEMSYLHLANNRADIDLPSTDCRCTD